MKHLLFFLSCLLCLLSCQFNKSVHRDLTTGMYTTGDGLSAHSVYLSTETEDIARNTFTYGEKIFIVFEDMSGFVKKNDYAIPGLRMAITSKAGDTLLQNADLYADSPEGFDVLPLTLNTDLVIAAPIHSGDAYTWHVGIWDKNGKGKFSSTLDFTVIPNALLNVESTVSYDEIYLFSRDRGRVITDNVATSSEDIFILFEGLTGFAEENNAIFPGLSLKVTDPTGNKILDEADLFDDIGTTGIPPSDFNQLISAQLTFPKVSEETEVECEAMLWDKHGEGKVKVTTKLTLK